MNTYIYSGIIHIYFKFYTTNEMVTADVSVSSQNKHRYAPDTDITKGQFSLETLLLLPSF